MQTFNTKYVRGGMSRNVRNKTLKTIDVREVLWGINLKPGDIFNSFDGWDHVVKSIEIEWRSVRRGYLSFKTLKKKGYVEDKLVEGRSARGEYVSDVEIHSEDGMMHFLSESGCIVPAFGREYLRKTHHPESFDWYELCGIINHDGVLQHYPTDEERALFDEIIMPVLKEKYGVDEHGQLNYIEYDAAMNAMHPPFPPISKYYPKVKIK